MLWLFWSHSTARMRRENISIIVYKLRLFLFLFLLHWAKVCSIEDRTIKPYYSPFNNLLFWVLSLILEKIQESPRLLLCLSALLGCWTLDLSAWPCCVLWPSDAHLAILSINLIYQAVKTLPSCNALMEVDTSLPSFCTCRTSSN